MIALSAGTIVDARASHVAFLRKQMADLFEAAPDAELEGVSGAVSSHDAHFSGSVWMTDLRPRRPPDGRSPSSASGVA